MCCLCGGIVESLVPLTVPWTHPIRQLVIGLSEIRSNMARRASLDGCAVRSSSSIPVLTLLVIEDAWNLSLREHAYRCFVNCSCIGDLHNDPQWLRATREKYLVIGTQSRVPDKSRKIFSETTRHIDSLSSQAEQNNKRRSWLWRNLRWKAQPLCDGKPWVISSQNRGFSSASRERRESFVKVTSVIVNSINYRAS